MKPNVTSDDKTFPIVAIGASAGGLNSLQCFLSILPKDFGFAVVFMQHLSPKHKSLLPELLRNRRPGLDINEVSDEMEVLPGKLYLCPPGKEIKIIKTTFQVSDTSGEHFHLPIDEFFSSLAEEAGERVIAVIFSGAGTDGARGVLAIRNAGGTVFVQDPETAEFPAMPAAAIGTGQADRVLPPEEIAREILRICSTGAVAAPSESVLAPGEFEAFYRVIREKSGHRFEHYKKSVVGRRIRRRMCLRGVSSVDDYINILTNKESEAVSLAADLMIGVTSFFRDPLAWKALRIGVVRKLAAAEEDSPVRVWTSACATGEEAYSIAIMLQQEFDLAGRKREIQVFATDVNDQALERAREGKYPGSIAADVPPEYMRKFFTCSDDGLSVVIDKGTRERVIFAKQDLLTDPPFSKLDLIICRNLLIYLEPVAQEKCLALFHYALKEDGYLFLGNAESVGKNKALFRSLSHKKCRIYQKIDTGQPSRLSLSVPFASERSSAVPPRQTAPTERSVSAVEIIQETLLGEFAPAAVAIDQSYDILYHNGPTNRYLRQPRGAPTQNLLELLPKSLRSRIKGALFRAAQEAGQVSIRTILTNDDGKKRQLVLRISKLRDNLFLVIFREKRGASEEAEALYSEATVDDNAVRQLEGELAATRAELQSNIEQLKSLNEELQSSNEELQAANEELETSREELQSLNEELITVNSQLQSKIEEQEETNNDLNNFFSSTNIPTFFLDHQFRVKRFTPAMSTLLKLIPSDVGRPIVDMSQENLGPDLIADAQSVLDNLVPKKREIAISGTWYVRAALPYRTSDNRIEGVVITYTDITEIRKAEEVQGHLAAIVESAEDAIIGKDLDGIILTWNVGAENIFGYKAEEVIGKPVSLLVPPGHTDEVPEILERIKQGEHIEHFETIRMRKDGTIIPVSLTFSAIKDASGNVIGASKIAHDITIRKNHEQHLAKQARLLDLSSDAICIRDAQDRITYWNDSAAEIYGYSREEGLGKVSHELLHSEFPEPLEYIQEKLHRDGRWSGELVHTCKDGSRIIVNSRWVLSPDAYGNPSILETNTDITERKWAENIMQARLRLAKAAYSGDISADEILRLTLDELEAQTGSVIGFYHFLEADQETLSLQSWSTNTIKTMCTAEGKGSHYNISQAGVWVDCVRERRPVIHNDYASLPHRKGMPAGHAPVIREMVVPIMRGERIIAIIGIGNKKTDYTTADTEIAQLLGDFSWEIVERKKAEEALRKGEERYRSLFENMLHGVAHCKMLYDEGGRPLDFIYLNVNSAFGKLTGLENVAGRRVTDVIPGIREAHPGLFDIYGRVALTGEPEKFEIEFKPLGRWLSVSVYSPAQEHFVAIFDDITERRQAEVDVLHLSEDMAARNVELEIVNKELESFIYSISHDLRAPIRTMSGFARIVVEDYAGRLDEKGRDYLVRILMGSEKMTRLIDDLLHLSKISRQEMVRTKVDMSKIASSIAAELRESNPGRKVEVSIAEGLAAFADPRLIEIVLLNLLGNAWKFTSKTETACIEFGVVAQDGKSIFFVRDNGAGFNPEYVEKIFLPFHRLHSDSEFEGTGIGLTIVERIIHRHGGRIWAEGEKGKGATIYFTLGQGDKSSP